MCGMEGIFLPIHMESLFFTVLYIHAGSSFSSLTNVNISVYDYSLIVYKSKESDPFSFILLNDF